MTHSLTKSGLTETSQQLVIDINEQPETSQNAALLAFELETIQTLGRHRTAELKLLLRHGSSIDNWATPPGWLPGGKSRTRPPVNLQQRILHFLPVPLRDELQGRSKALLDRAVLALTHYLILLRIAPSATGRAAGRSLKPSNILSIAYGYGPQLFARAINALNSTLQTQTEIHPSLADYDGPLLVCLNFTDLDGLSWMARQQVIKECQRMHMLFSMGVWSDVPTLENESRVSALLGPARFNTAAHLRDSHLPLPDEYVAALSSRCLWLIRDLAPNLFTLGEEMITIWRRSAEGGTKPKRLRDLRREAVKVLLAQYEWRDSFGKPFSEPRFAIKLPVPKGFGASDDDSRAIRWPPQGYIDYKCLVGMVQSAHLCIVFLSTGGRQSEVIDLQRSCLVHAVDGRGYANGRTFKLVQTIDGTLRDWQLPEVAINAIEQQVRLVELGEIIGSLKPWPESYKAQARSHLWVSAAVNRKQEDLMMPLSDINSALTALAERLGLDVNPGGQRLRSHRFRKTLARLVALALTQAPKILMDIFGHKSLEMALYYILTDKDLRAEIEKVSRELRVMRAKEVIEKMVDTDTATLSIDNVPLAGYGGLAAVTVRTSIQVHQERVHRRGDDWNANSAIELAELLTLQGQAWEQVRQGVICTKLPGEAGPCNKSKGRPEPSKCASSCGHRLEEGFLREDIDGSIADSVVAYEQATTDAEALTASHWAAQIRTHVPRFTDLRDKWMANATVQKVMLLSAGLEGT